MSVVERILNLVERNGITAAQLLRETGLHGTTITQWRKGAYKPSADAIFKIASYFGVSTDFLLTGKEFKDADATATATEDAALTMPPELQDIFSAVHDDNNNFTQAELNEIADFVNFVRLKRKSRKKVNDTKTRAIPRLDTLSQ